MNISSEEEFIEYLSKSGKIPSRIEFEVSDITIEKLRFTSFSTVRFKFKKCNFLDCQFEDFEFNGVEFNNSRFEGCYFQNVTIMDCSLTDCIFERAFSNRLLFGMTPLENVEFNEVEFQFTTFSDCRVDKVTFNRGSLGLGGFETGDFTYMLKTRVAFNNISLGSVTFDNLDLTETVFKDCEIKINLINCNVSSTTFKGNESKDISSVDFFTILKSENLPVNVLKTIFGITNRNIKEILSDLTTEPNFHSVFISYSFKDAQIANELKHLLNINQVKTFLWEHDALGGRKMKKIMIDGIRNYEKFLFIASENSLKSEACHYEIAEAREKYYQSWVEIFVPIHIDNYLFEIRKEDIPSKFAQPYWENIRELKEIHSLDFTFIKNKGKIDSNAQFERLLKTLKLKRDGNLK